MKSIRFTEKSVPIAFAIVILIAYGLLLPFTGFHWDDWPFAWIAKFLGPKEFMPAFASFRPFLGPIFFLTTSIIPPNPIYWQIFALIIRFIGGLSFWFAFKQIFPTLKRQTLAASLLFLVFPGYSQHWVALTHINQEWIPFIFYLLSFGFTARALRNPQNFSRNTVYALLLLIAGVVPTEYFIGLEPLRFLFILFIVAEETKGFKDQIIQSLKRWLPYLFIWLANAAWLFYYYKFGGYNSYDVATASEPIAPGYIFSSIVEAIWKAGFYVWGQVLVLSAQSITAPTTLITLALILLTLLLIASYFIKHTFTQTSSLRFAWQAILIGIAGILLGRVPSFAAGLPLTLQSSYDRFMISMMVGGSLFMIGLVELIVRSERIKLFVLAFLIALGIGQQFFNANIFRRDWAKQKEIYWQMAWRMPGIQPNTVLLTNQMPIDYETDMSFTAPINWMYAPDYKEGNLPYLLLYTEKRIGGGVLPEIKPGIDIKFPYRTVKFQGNTSQAIVIYMPKNGCLRVLDPTLGDAETYSKQPASLTSVIPLSNPSLIITNPNVTAEPMFFAEPEHTWCYYYDEAELARQMKDWGKIIALEKEAAGKGYKPEDVFEWLPFIEANALTENFNDAEKLSRTALAEDKGIRKGLCEVWKRVQAQSPRGGGAESRVNGMLLQFQCSR